MGRIARLLLVASTSGALAACAGLDGSVLGRAAVNLASYPGAEQQIRDYYERHGQEGDGACGQVELQTITRAARLSDTPDELKLAFHYEFSSVLQSGGDTGMPDYCHDGFNTRIATFKKSPTGGLTLEKLSGELGGF